MQSKVELLFDVEQFVNVKEELLSVQKLISSGKFSSLGEPEKQQPSSVDSEDIPMMVYYTTHGHFQRGEDAGCLWCAELLRRGKSTTKHMLGCPAQSRNTRTVSEVGSHSVLQQSSYTITGEVNTE